MQRTVVAAMKLRQGLTQAALSQLENIAKDLLLKRVEIQHQESYICMSIRIVMKESLLLMSILALLMKNMKKYCGKKQCLKHRLINVKHIIKLWGEKRREEYTVLILKQNVTTGRNFVPHHHHFLQFLNQHR